LHETLRPAHRRVFRGRSTIRPRAPLGAAAGLCAALLGALLLTGCGSSSSDDSTSAVEATPAALRTLARDLQQPIYWVGPGTNVVYERTKLASGRILVRYLPEGTKIGTSKPFLTVGTYTLPDAYAATQHAASQPGAVQIKTSSSAIAFSTKSHPLNAWITYPGSRYQIEVFDPTPGAARKFVASGKVIRVPGSPRESRPEAVTAKGLARLVADAGHPVYWAGPQAGQTYELTRTSQGGFLVRFLPPGAAVGVATPFLTVGTYPVKNAMAAVRRLSSAKGATSIPLTGGGLAAVNPHFPRSVYLAFPASNYEVEVFDPSLAHAKELVTTGQIVAVVE
jgi:hypothetical protein